MEKRTEQIAAVAKQCGQIMLEAGREDLAIVSKEGSANFVTRYDTAIQEKLRVDLGKIVPDAVFIGEEGEQASFLETGSCFIVDPIDGTTNFIKDYHMSCVSIALLTDGLVETGVIYNPYLDELYYAERGKGAFCNGKRLMVSKQPLENGIVLFGTSPYHEELNQPTFEMAYAYFRRALDIRRSGSAALDLCAIAAGRAEVYFELILSPWDYAAGSLLVTEAGGLISTVEGGEISFDKPCSILAKNK